MRGLLIGYVGVLAVLCGCDSRSGKQSSSDNASPATETFAPAGDAKSGGAKTADGEPAEAPASHTHEHTGHDHHHHDSTAAGPHGGCMVAVGDHFAHAEFVFDSGDGRITLYLMDCDQKGMRSDLPVVEAQIQRSDGPISVALTAVASELTGEKSGDTSVFSGRDDRLKGMKSAAGKLAKLRIKGTDFSDVAFECAEAVE
jgi:hypothetical protein